MTTITRRLRFVLLRASFIPSPLIHLDASRPCPRAPSPAANMGVQQRISARSWAAYPSRCQQWDAFFGGQKTAAVVSAIADKRSASVRRDRAAALCFAPPWSICHETVACASTSHLAAVLFFVAGSRHGGVWLHVTSGTNPGRAFLRSPPRCVSGSQRRAALERDLPAPNARAGLTAVRRG